MGGKKRNSEVRSPDILLQFYVPTAFKQAFEDYAEGLDVSVSELGRRVIFDDRRRPKMDADVTARILEMKTSSTCQQIADQLNEDGIKTPRGMAWTATRVAGVIQRHRQD
jgi:hypothetical protein